MDAGRALGGLLLLLTVFIILIEEGLGIECYCCNTKYHGKECDDLETISPKRKELYAQNCALLGADKNYTQCRKIVQEVEDDTRVIRQCATVGNDGCVKRTGTQKIKMTYCECSGNLCNTAANRYDVSTVLFLCASLVSWMVVKLSDI
ncbi:hypothetical protein ScPMuIL_003782 [Solemya velum]